MTPRLSFRPGARAEIREARRWYEVQVPGLGRAFLAELDATLAFVLRHPAMYEAVEPDGAVRRALLHRFPYAIVYGDPAGWRHRGARVLPRAPRRARVALASVTADVALQLTGGLS